MDWSAHCERGWVAYLLGTSRGCWHCSKHWMGITCWIFCGKNHFSTPSTGFDVWYQGQWTHRWNPFSHPSFHPSSCFRSGIRDQGSLFMDGLFSHLYARSHSTFLKTSSCLQIWAGPLLGYPIQKFLGNSAQRNSKGGILMPVWSESF